MKPVAIIGMSAIFPNADNLQDFWENILNEVDCITDVPPSRWDINDYYDPDPQAPDKSYSKRGGFIPDIDFDPVEFGLPPNLLEVTDVSQLLSLVAVKACLEDGGYGDSAGVSRENVGVILGMVGVGSKLMTPLMARLQYPVWDKVLKSYGISASDRQDIIDKIKLAYPEWEENAFPGAIGNVVAGRIANRFDLGGTSCVIDAACASSLAAIRMAVSELSEGHADMMITGGVDTDNSIGAFLCFSKTPAFTRGDHVRPFDKDSGGMLVGEGIGIVLLKRLEDAQRDGDRVYVVIKGVGSSSDGRYKSIYAPCPDGQSLALQRAYDEAGFNPATAGLIEAHGTGTIAGDPAEFQGLNSVFSQDNDQKQYIALGSIKSQIGHTKAAAGVASLIKTALALHNKILPPTINVDQPNPKFVIEDSPFYLNTESQPWISPIAHPRRAGVSAFGFGGTNFHVVLEENESEHTRAYRTHTTGKMILLSAPDEHALLAECGSWIQRLSADSPAMVLHALAVQSADEAIPENHARVGFIAMDEQDLREKLETAVELIKLKGTEEFAEHPTGVFYRRFGVQPEGKVVALFPGQGSQYVKMGSQVAENFPEVRQAFAKADSLFLEASQPPLSKTVFPIPVFNQAQREEQARKLTETKFAQPAIGTLSMGFEKILEKAGFKPDFVAGHSFGELTALWAAGVMDDEDFLFLTKARGEAMAPLPDEDFDAGTMLAVKGAVENLKADLEELPEVSLANINANNQVVLAGSKPAIEQAQKVLAEKDYTVIPLDVSAAFHTPLVGHAQQPFAEAVNQVRFSIPDIPIYSNSTGKKYPSDPDAIKKILEGHILNSVNFKDEIEAIYTKGGSVFVEIGPKSILTNLVNNILEGKPHVAVALNPNSKKDSDVQFREAIVKLCVLGLNLQDFDPYFLANPPQPEKKKSPASVKLNGGLYLSEKTKTAFENAINQQNTLDYKANVQSTADLPENYTTETALEQTSPFDNLTQAIADQPVLASGFQSIQQDTLSVHNKFLENDIEYARIFNQLTQQQLGLLNGKSSQADLEQINNILQTLDNSMMQFHQHQAETLRMHKQYLSNQAELLKNLLATTRSFPGLTTPLSTSYETKHSTVPHGTIAHQEAQLFPPNSIQPGGSGHKPAYSLSETEAETDKASSTPAAVIDLNSLASVLLEIVSDKTGYPIEMLELEMDLEADLGIDSIKRVEILGAMQASFPDLPQAEPAVLSEMRTLGEIVDHLSSVAADLSVNTPPSQTAPPDTDYTATDRAGTGKDAPVENSLAEMRTLAEIVAHMPSQESADTAPTSTPAGESESSQTVSSAPAPREESPTPDIKALTQSVLTIVSKKTGYPPEMLDLEMDFEADLGIDSIKRVEILGAVEEKFPDLPPIDPAELAELNTLQQIIDSFSQPDSPDLPADAPESITREVSAPPTRGVIAIDPLPLPDCLIVKPADDQISLVVDDGSQLTTKIVEKLIQLENTVIVLSLPENLVVSKAALPESVERVELEDTEETTIQAALKKIEEKFGTPNIFIHLDPACNRSKPFSEVEKTIVKTVFLVAKHLAEPLTRAGENGYAAFLTVARLDGQFGLSQVAEIDPLSGGLFGLTKSLNLEWENVFCRAIDLHPDLDVEKAAEFITAELFDPNQLISEVAYAEEGRFTLTVRITESETQA